MRKSIILTLLIGYLTIPFLVSVWRTGNFYIYPLDIIVCNETDRCKHEEGHRLDKQLDYVSQSYSFQKTVDNYKKDCKIIDDTLEFDAKVSKAVLCKVMEGFPGVFAPFKPYSNPIQAFFYGYHDKKGWGGYDELYAKIHEFNELIVLPYELQKFYE